jgi:hypothetical protein
MTFSLADRVKARAQQLGLTAAQVAEIAEMKAMLKVMGVEAPM